MLQRLLKYLDDSGVAYNHTVHRAAFRAREVASAEHIPERRLAKTVVFFADAVYGMAVLPADSIVDMQELRLILDMPRLRLATEEELSALFPDCETGAMPPLGNLFGLRVFVDSSLGREHTIAFNAGTHSDVVHMRYQDFERLARPILVCFARRAAAV